MKRRYKADSGVYFIVNGKGEYLLDGGYRWGARRSSRMVFVSREAARRAVASMFVGVRAAAENGIHVVEKEG